MTPEICVGQCGDKAAPIDAMNRDCGCLSLDEEALRSELVIAMESRGALSAMLDTHPHLFSALPFYVAQRHINQMVLVSDAIEQVAHTARYRDTVLSWAPEIAAFDPGSPGGMLGLDFHMGPDGPQLIEINTNPGGALLNAILARAQQACCQTLAVPPTDPVAVDEMLAGVVLREWQLQGSQGPLKSIAIVDEVPEQQYLYPEFLLFQQLFERQGVAAVICAPAELSRRDGKVWRAAQPIDLVYNRLTDFSLSGPALAPLRSAYLSREVVISPHPWAHAIYADKRNLTLLCDATFLESTGLPHAAIQALLAAVPQTQRVTPENRERLWNDRRQFFFKPAAGYGSKATYRGSKLTRRVWEDIAGSDYVAQAFVTPSERHSSGILSPLKADIRAYAYQGEVLEFAARLYQGQTTNFRTPGGGFAPVLSERIGAGAGMQSRSKVI